MIDSGLRYEDFGIVSGVRLITAMNVDQRLPRGLSSPPFAWDGEKAKVTHSFAAMYERACCLPHFSNRCVTGGYGIGVQIFAREMQLVASSRFTCENAMRVF